MLDREEFAKDVNSMSIEIRTLCKKLTEGMEPKKAIAMSSGALAVVLAHMMGFMEYAAGSEDTIDNGIKAIKEATLARINKQLADLREDAKVWKKEFENDNSTTRSEK